MRLGLLALLLGFVFGSITVLWFVGSPITLFHCRWHCQHEEGCVDWNGLVCTRVSQNDGCCARQSKRGRCPKCLGTFVQCMECCIASNHSGWPNKEINYVWSRCTRVCYPPRPDIPCAFGPARERFETFPVDPLPDAWTERHKGAHHAEVRSVPTRDVVESPSSGVGMPAKAPANTEAQVQYVEFH